jgi:hypothetical protein
MPLKRVTCPETAHHETIELEPHPLGALIAGCSRFSPWCELACTRRCAAMIDRCGRSRYEPGEVTLASLKVGDQTRVDLELDAGCAMRRDS